MQTLRNQTLLSGIWIGARIVSFLTIPIPTDYQSAETLEQNKAESQF